MKPTAVVICPGRGTYNKAELGVLTAHAPADMIAGFDAQRRAAQQPTLTELDQASRFSNATHTRGDNAAGLIYGCSMGDIAALGDIEIVAVTGNSMGWYTALAAAGAVSIAQGFEIVNTMGRLMHEHAPGGQIIYPVVGDDWRPDNTLKSEVIGVISAIANLYVSIDLGGMIVVAGDNTALAAFENAMPKRDRFPMRLPNHAAFHTPLMTPIAEMGRAALPARLFDQPKLPMIDGRGHIWWPQGTDPAALRDYTLGHQVTETYDFTRAITVAAREFAPDLFIIPGPGTTLGGAVAQSLIAANWWGMSERSSFQTLQTKAPRLISMGRPEQRSRVT